MPRASGRRRSCRTRLRRCRSARPGCSKATTACRFRPKPAASCGPRAVTRSTWLGTASSWTTRSTRSTSNAASTPPSPSLWADRADALEHEACALLGVPTLREWFRRPAGFFADHLKRYSKSRRQAPIYWPLSTPSGSYTLWLYYHRLNDRDALHVRDRNL